MKRTRAAAQATPALDPEEREAVQRLEEEIEAVRNGTHKDFYEEVLLLEERHAEHVKEAETLHRWRLASLKQVHTGDLKAAGDQLAEHKAQLLDSMVQELAARKRMIERLPEEGRMTTRNKGKEAAKSRRKTSTVASRQIRVALPDQDVQSDLSLMRGGSFYQSMAVGTGVYTDSQNVLHAHGQQLRMGQNVRCLRSSDGYYFYGRISSLNNVDLHAEDLVTGLEVRIWIAHIRRRMWSVTAAPSRMSRKERRAAVPGYQLGEPEAEAEARMADLVRPKARAAATEENGEDNDGNGGAGEDGEDNGDGEEDGDATMTDGKRRAAVDSADEAEAEAQAAAGDAAGGGDSSDERPRKRARPNGDPTPPPPSGRPTRSSRRSRAAASSSSSAADGTPTKPAGRVTRTSSRTRGRGNTAPVEVN